MTVESLTLPNEEELSTKLKENLTLGDLSKLCWESTWLQAESLRRGLKRLTQEEAHVYLHIISFTIHAADLGYGVLNETAPDFTIGIRYAAYESGKNIEEVKEIFAKARRGD